MAAYLSIAMPDGSTLVLPRPALQALEDLPRAQVVTVRRPAELDDADRDPRLATFFPRLRVPKSPDYSTPAAVTARAIEAGSGAGADIRARLKTNGKQYRELCHAIEMAARRMEG